MGVRTTGPVKKLGCSVLKSLVENDKLLIDDMDIIQELYTFVAKGASFEVGASLPPHLGASFEVGASMPPQKCASFDSGTLKFLINLAN